ncbi:MAG: hypothetical protein WCW44_01785 [archaeon]|jgi:hypothetical protein
MKRKLLPPTKAAVVKTPVKARHILVKGEGLLGNKWVKRVLVPEQYQRNLTPFKKAVLRAVVRYGSTAARLRDDAWGKRFVLRLAKNEVRNKKFYTPAAAQRALIALIDVHSKGKKFIEDKGYSEDYDHPQIGEIAIPAKRKVVFRKSALEDAPLLDDKVRARDVGYLTYSVNLPFCCEKYGFDYRSKFDPPLYPINVEKFAEEYAKRTGVKDVPKFIEDAKQSVKSLNWDHWDHAADHI